MAIVFGSTFQGFRKIGIGPSLVGKVIRYLLARFLANAKNEPPIVLAAVRMSPRPPNVWSRGPVSHPPYLHQLPAQSQEQLAPMIVQLTECVVPVRDQVGIHIAFSNEAVDMVLFVH